MPRPVGVTEPHSLDRVETWQCHLRRHDIERVAVSAADLLVIDPMTDGVSDPTVTSHDVARLQIRPDGRRRLVFAHCAIAEARHVGLPATGSRRQPAWLIGEHPVWPECFAVRFWRADWQARVYGSPSAIVDRIIARGFDGLYLDDGDAADELRHHFQWEAATPADLDAHMVALISRVAGYARKLRPDFLIILQNGDRLLRAPDLRDAIDAVAIEDLLYGLDGAQRPNRDEDIAQARSRLDPVRRSGKSVFTVEYLAEPGDVRRAREINAQLGYVLTVTPPDGIFDGGPV